MTPSTGVAVVVERPSVDFSDPARDRFAVIAGGVPEVFAVDHKMLHQMEKGLAQDIADKESPVLIITEKSAVAWAGMASRIAAAFPNVPIIFENDIAERKFNSAVPARREAVASQIIGHFIEAAQWGARQKKIPQSDCYIVLGNPNDTTRKILEGKPHYISHAGVSAHYPRVNLSLIEGAIAGQTDKWARWLKTARRP